MEPTEKAPPIWAKRRLWLNRLLTPGKTLPQRAIHGGFWVFALRIVTRLLGLLRTIILARLLAPEDFGLFGIALLAMSALETFSQTGFQAALIQKKDDTMGYLDTAWTVQAIRGGALALVLFGIAPYAGAFFGEPAATALLRALSVSVLFTGFANIGIVYFRKELEFHKIFAYELSGTVADVVVAVSAAIILRHAWALILGFMAGNFVRMVGSYVMHPYRPRARLERAKLRKLYGFGRWILGSSIVNFFNTQGDDAFVAKILGSTALGIYQMAYRISNLPATEITHVVSQVTFPAYSKLQDRLPQLREGYLQALQVTAFASIPLAGAILVLAPDFTQIFLGERWVAVVPAMRVLALWGLIRSIGATTGPLFQAVGRPDLVTKLQLTKLVILALLIYPLTVKWGVLGTSLAVLLSAMIVNPCADILAIRIVRCRAWEFAKLIAFPALGTLVMVGALLLSKHVVLDSVGFLSFLALVAIAAFVYYILTAHLFDSLFDYKIRATIEGRLASRPGVD